MGSLPSLNCSWLSVSKAVNGGADQFCLLLIGPSYGIRCVAVVLKPVTILSKSHFDSSPHIDLGFSWVHWHSTDLLDSCALQPRVATSDSTYGNWHGSPQGFRCCKVAVWNRCYMVWGLSSRGLGCCLTVFTAVKRHHDYGNSYKGKHFIGTSLQVQRVNPVLWWEAWCADGHDAGE